jgi:hypothetical protein
LAGAIAVYFSRIVSQFVELRLIVAPEFGVSLGFNTKPRRLRTAYGLSSYCSSNAVLPA